MMPVHHDEQFMRRALALAKKGRTSPNPRVGAVIVRGGSVIGEGYHRKAGQPHAEREALRAADGAEGATLYVTLEPCSHYGRTPPCTDAIIGAGITRVVCAVEDPNPAVSGIELLRAAGIDVEVGLMAEEARALNEAYFFAMERGRPYFVLKTAMSLDGKTATRGGDSMWITSPASRDHAHRLRGEHDALVVGIGTVLSDNPRLRAVDGPDPLRIILDSSLRLPLDAAVLGDRNVLVVTTARADAAKAEALRARGAEVLVCGDHRVDLPALAAALHEREIRSVLLEGGSAVHGAFMDAGLVDKVMVYIAPLLIGGASAVPAVGGTGVERLADAMRLGAVTVQRLGDDLLVTGTPQTRP